MTQGVVKPLLLAACQRRAGEHHLVSLISQRAEVRSIGPARLGSKWSLAKDVTQTHRLQVALTPERTQPGGRAWQ